MYREHWSSRERNKSGSQYDVPTSVLFDFVFFSEARIKRVNDYHSVDHGRFCP